MRLNLFAGVALAPLAFATAAFAQQAPDPNEPVESVLEAIIVTGEPVMRNRTEDTAPTLSYDYEYFQRFEPLTVGDAMKRVPSVGFLSDVLEYDGVRLRGLDSGYAQILINGERVPGAGIDRSFFVDRIPAELIERVELVRSASANRSGDAMAGALNIVLRDGYALDGGYIRLGALHYNDSEYGEWGGTFGGVWGGEVGPGRLLLGANIQDRRNPKEKYSQRFDRPGGTLDNTEVQTDVRDGTDYSFNASYVVPFEGAELDLSAVFVRTDRYQDEDSWEYVDGIEDTAHLASVNDNDLDILTDNLALKGKLTMDMAGGETALKLGYAMIDDDQYEFEYESEYLRDANPFPDEDRFTADATSVEIRDEEFQGALEHKRELATGNELEFGVQWAARDRDANITEAPRVRFNVPAGQTNADTPWTFAAFNPVPGGVSTIKENRFDPYVMLSGEHGDLKWEAGLRYETTHSSIKDETSLSVVKNDYEFLLPSVSLRWKLTDDDRITVSAARTVRRPNFNHLSPALLEEEVGDSDFIGNPNLKPESAVGLDVGYERRLGRTGVFGINAFYRDVSDLIEDVNTGAMGSGGAGTFVYTVDNVGDGQVWGVEFDLSTPLDFVNLPDTGVFLNYSWLDSEVEDFMGTRRFNDQSDYIFNVGFTHDLTAWDAAFGATYREQGDALSRVLVEEVKTSYGGDLEVFVEKKLADNVVVRLTGSNLLDASKDEVFDKFDNVADQLARSYDEYELETESSGPFYQLVMRIAF